MAAARRTLSRWLSGSAALMVVLATAASSPKRAEPGDAALYERCRKTFHDVADRYRSTGDDLFKITVAVVCTRPDGTVADPKLWLPATPAPIPPTISDDTICVTGPRRPVLGKTPIRVSVTPRAGKGIIYQYQPLDGSEDPGFAGAEVLEFRPGDLVPGKSYRWRARFDDTADQPSTPVVSAGPDDEQGWSPWCEFTLSARSAR